MNIDIYLEDIKQVALKNRVYYLGSIIVVAAAIISILHIWPPKVRVDESRYRQFEKRNTALTNQNSSLKDLIASQQNLILITTHGDSNIIVEVIKNRKIYLQSIKKSAHENNIINSYNSNELTREVAEIERQYSPAQ